MSGLANARAMMNWRVRQQLDAADIFDPASLDYSSDGPALLTITEDDALALDDGRMTMTRGGPAPAMDWEIWL